MPGKRARALACAESRLPFPIDVPEHGQDDDCDGAHAGDGELRLAVHFSIGSHVRHTVGARRPSGRLSWCPRVASSGFMRTRYDGPLTLAPALRALCLVPRLCHFGVRAEGRWHLGASSQDAVALTVTLTTTRGMPRVLQR